MFMTEKVVSLQDERKESEDRAQEYDQYNFTRSNIKGIYFAQRTPGTK